MPKTISENITEILRSGQVPSGDAVAMAMEEVKRKAVGGAAVGAQKDAGKTAPKMGLVHSRVPGRTDKHPVDVPDGTYVFPADAVSGLGEGNTMAGATVLDEFFEIQKSAGGAVSGAGPLVEIIVAGGEYLVPPDRVAAKADGDLDAGHKLLDKMVLKIRDETKKTLGKLPGPKK